MTITTRSTWDWVRGYRAGLIFFISLLFITSVVWNLYQHHQDTFEKARIEARTILQHNLAYRRWNTQMGGIYAEVSERNPPNVYLQVSRRDIVAEGGMQLTLINPFRMTKQAYDLLHEQSPSLAAINRTVSLNPLNPENRPDPWEREALLAFEEGKDEVSAITEIGGSPYMRLLSPYVTEEGCLKCHGMQGYNIGDIRGGMSIAVPMEPYNTAAAPTRRIILISHLVLWLLSVGMVLFFSRGIHRYQATISENERRMRIVSEFAYNIETWIGKTRETLFISPSCKRITGYAPEEFMADPNLFLEIVHPDDRERYQRHLHDIQEPPHEDIEFRIITKEGELRWLAHTCSPIVVAGEFLGRRGSDRDITDKKRLEEELMEAKKMECLGCFARGIAHDFNNILSSVVTFTHMLYDEVDTGNQQINDYLAGITIASRIGKNMTSNLLSFGRNRTTRPRQVRLGEIVTDVSDVLKTLLDDEIDFAVDFAAAEEPVFADPHSIEQILINLCTNAKDAMPGGGTLTIRTAPQTLAEPLAGVCGEIPAGSYMALEVADTGIGISDQNLSRIFEPFFTEKENCRGTGLGLAIIDTIVRQHGASIDVESRKGKGTTFKILLPLDEAVLAELPSQGPAVTAAEAKGDLVLVVDDDELVRRSLEGFLHKQGCRTVTAATAAEGIALYRIFGRDLGFAILDVMLPDGTGRDVFEVIREERADLPVIFVSGDLESIPKANLVFDEQVPYLKKPLDLRLLSFTIEQLGRPDRSGGGGSVVMHV